MDSILSGLVILLLFLLAAFTLTARFFDAQQDIQTAWQEMENRMDEQDRAAITPVEAQIASGGTVAELTYRNTGSTRFVDFETWDVIVQYATEDAGTSLIRWVPEDKSAAANTWKVSGIYHDAVHLIPEVQEPDILNPGEEIVLHVQIQPPVGHGQVLVIIVMTSSGAPASLQTIRNMPPVLVVNDGVSLTSRTTADILNKHLQAIDTDNPSEDLLFSVATPPQQGELSLPVTFTQAQINAGLLIYTHTGDGDDQFTFFVSDESDAIGSYTFIIETLNAEPILVTNYILDAAVGADTTLDGLVLSTTDVDNAPADLTYIVHAPPTLGTLIPGNTFSQADLDAGTIAYRRTGVGLDSFEFSVTDGQATIGPFTFYIAMP